MILLVIRCSSTCFGCLYAHPQEVRLRFHCLWLSVLLWCWRVGWQAVCTVWSRLQATTGQKTIGSENAVWPPEDGRKDTRNMLRNIWLPIKSLIVVSSWSHIYLPSILNLYLRGAVTQVHYKLCAPPSFPTPATTGKVHSLDLTTNQYSHIPSQFTSKWKRGTSQQRVN